MLFYIVKVTISFLIDREAYIVLFAGINLAHKLKNILWFYTPQAKTKYSLKDMFFFKRAILVFLREFSTIFTPSLCLGLEVYTPRAQKKFWRSYAFIANTTEKCLHMAIFMTTYWLHANKCHMYFTIVTLSRIRAYLPSVNCNEKLRSRNCKTLEEPSCGNNHTSDLGNKNHENPKETRIVEETYTGKR